MRFIYKDQINNSGSSLPLLTKVICGFPGVGKSYLYNNQNLFNIVVKDSDSSIFSHKILQDGTKTKNPDFPNNYIKHIKSLVDSDEIDFIFVSTHSDVRNALEKANIPYVLVYPQKELKDSYMNRYKIRKSPKLFLDILDKNFNTFVEDCNSDKNAICKVVFTDEKETLYDYIQFSKTL